MSLALLAPGGSPTSLPPLPTLTFSKKLLPGTAQHQAHSQTGSGIPRGGDSDNRRGGRQVRFFTDIFCGSFPVKVTGKLAGDLGSADSLPEKCTQE